MKDIKWLTEANSTDDGMLSQHAYKKVVSKFAFYTDEYFGNKSLCGRFFITKDAESPVPFDELEDSEPIKNSCCKTCLKIYNKL